MSFVIKTDVVKKIDSAELVEMALDILKEITVMGYIPFESPNPSSSEIKVRDAIRVDIRALEGTLDIMHKLSGDKTAPPQEGICEKCHFYKYGICAVYGTTVYGRALRACYRHENE